MFLFVTHVFDFVQMCSFMFQVAKCKIKVECKADKITELKGEIGGPPDTVYEGGTFILDIKIPDTYPFNPPKVRLI